jgi:hypothetical protein
VAVAPIASFSSPVGASGRVTRGSKRISASTMGVYPGQSITTTEGTAHQVRAIVCLA